MEDGPPGEGGLVVEYPVLIKVGGCEENMYDGADAVGNGSSLANTSKTGAPGMPFLCQIFPEIQCGSLPFAASL